MFSLFAILILSLCIPNVSNKLPKMHWKFLGIGKWGTKMIRTLKNEILSKRSNRFHVAISLQLHCRHLTFNFIYSFITWLILNFNFNNVQIDNECMRWYNPTERWNNLQTFKWFFKSINNYLSKLWSIPAAIQNKTSKNVQFQKLRRIVAQSTLHVALH